MKVETDAVLVVFWKCAEMVLRWRRPVGRSMYERGRRPIVGSLTAAGVWGNIPTCIIHILLEAPVNTQIKSSYYVRVGSSWMDRRERKREKQGKHGRYLKDNRWTNLVTAGTLHMTFGHTTIVKATADIPVILKSLTNLFKLADCSVNIMRNKTG